MRKRGPEVLAKWRGLIAEQKRSGQSVAAFCRERGLCAPSLFAWKKRLSQSGTAETAGFVAVQVVEAGEPQSPAPCQRIEIRLGPGRSVMVEPGFSAAHLCAVLDVLEARA